METSAYAIVHFFPGGTKDQYEASVAAAHPGEGQRPPGQIFHAAGPSDGGWRVIAVHESKESWESFRDSTLMPLLQKGVEGGFTTMPDATEIPLHNLLM
ncbi:hypothetical protein [Arthrobacter sp. VKM Ac-2550]|uniref:hypothetical protein n=1 Tax=Crystallibacter permensis TaxID=1938888 RepID=UPI002227272D|nr:hypothetical protein [Arthrobacter sp. VKM Ac-2550]MCW2131602.1 hypothetical protein [Arthrobacter sp. VKM Ac-2550]